MSCKVVQRSHLSFYASPHSFPLAVVKYFSKQLVKLITNFANEASPAGLMSNVRNPPTMIPIPKGTNFGGNKFFRLITVRSAAFDLTKEPVITSLQMHVDIQKHRRSTLCVATCLDIFLNKIFD